METKIEDFAATRTANPALRRTLEPASSAISRLLVHALIWCFLIALAWLAHFSQSRNIGFYSDDQTFAVRPLAWSPQEFHLWLTTKTISYPEPQGRPLGFMLGILLPYLGDRLAGVAGMFIVGWWILSLNAILFYQLLVRSFDKPIPLLAAIGFILFPADTTRPFLCHAHILQPSLTFMLVASHLYLGGGKLRKGLAYFVVTLCLITYESALLPFFAIPLLSRSRDNIWRKSFIRHVMIVLGIIVLIGLSRKLGHEYRTEEASSGKAIVLLEIVAGSIIGPAAALWSFALRGSTSIRHLWSVPTDLLPLIQATGVFALLIWLCKPAKTPERPTEYSRDIRRAITFGVSALAVSYLMSFTHFPPGCLEGQTTSVHLAAVIGASVLFAAGITVILQRSTRQVTSIAIIAVYTSLLFIAATAEQDAYVTLWRERQQFWTRVMDLCPDLEDQTLILCDNQLPQPTFFVLANCWSDSVVLEQSFRFPDDFKQNPQVSCFPPDASGSGWRTWLARDATGRVVWSKSPYGRKIGEELVEGKTILLHMDGTGKLARSGGAIDIAGKPFRLRGPVARQQLPFTTQRFYDVLVKNAN